MKTKITKQSGAKNKNCEHISRYDLRKCEDNSIIKSVFAFTLNEAKQKLKAGIKCQHN